MMLFFVAVVVLFLYWIVVMPVSSVQPFQRHADMPRVVATLTTSPTRLRYMAPTLHSIVNQTYPVDRVILNLPPKFDRTGETYTIPDWLAEKFPQVEINHCDRDYGPVTKLLPTLDKVHDGFLWVVDDDQRYDARAVEVLIANFTSPNKVPCLSGLVTINKSVFEEASENGPVDVFEAYAGVLLHRSMFDYGFRRYVERAIENDVAKFSDDLVVSVYLKRRGYEIHRVGDDDVNITNHWKRGNVLRYGRQADALHHMPTSTVDRYRQALLPLEQIMWAMYESNG